MSERPTPETDAVSEDIGEIMGCMMVDKEFAQKLERERDKAREEVELRKDSLITAAAEIDRLKAQKNHWFEKAKKENERWLKAQEELNSITRERDEAREGNAKLRNIAERAINYLDQSYRDGFSDEASDLRYELEQLKEAAK